MLSPQWCTVCPFVPSLSRRSRFQDTYLHFNLYSDRPLPRLETFPSEQTFQAFVHLHLISALDSNTLCQHAQLNNVQPTEACNSVVWCQPERCWLASWNSHGTPFFLPPSCVVLRPCMQTQLRVPSAHLRALTFKHSQLNPRMPTNSRSSSVWVATLAFKPSI